MGRALTAVLAQRDIRSGSAPDELWREWLWHCSEDGRTWEIVRNIGDLRMHFGVTVAQWDAFTGVVGNFNDDLRILAAFPRSGLIGGISQASFPDGSILSPVQATQPRKKDNRISVRTFGDRVPRHRSMAGPHYYKCGAIETKHHDGECEREGVENVVTHRSCSLPNSDPRRLR